MLRSEGHKGDGACFGCRAVLVWWRTPCRDCTRGIVTLPLPGNKRAWAVAGRGRWNQECDVGFARPLALTVSLLGSGPMGDWNVRASKGNMALGLFSVGAGRPLVPAPGIDLDTPVYVA